MPLSINHSFPCPYCAAANTFFIDISAGQSQECITDCEICCRPILVRLELDAGDIIAFDALTE